MDIKSKFLIGVLGRDGHGALKKAIQRDGRLESIVLPRAIIGWLNFISRFEFEGPLPNVENSYVEFSKNEDGSFSGSIAVEDDLVHEFSNSDIYHVASAISLALGEEPSDIDSEIRDLVLVRLGKSIDALAKAQEIARTLHRRLEAKEESAEEIEKKKALSKVDLPGQTAKPIQQNAPLAPQPPTARQGKLPRPSLKTFKAPTLKIGKSEAERKCSMCGGHQFTNNKFTGCVCMAELSPLIKTTVYGDGIALDFKEDFNQEAWLLLSRYFRG